MGGLSISVSDGVRRLVAAIGKGEKSVREMMAIIGLKDGRIWRIGQNGC